MDEIKKLEFEKALELRNFEIQNFWKRGWFFGALILATASGYFTNLTTTNQLVPPIFISFLIFLFSLFQSLMNRGSKYWQERWEYLTKNRETELGINLTKAKKYNGNERYYIDTSILAKDENIFAMAQRISVSKLAFLVWDIICISSLMLWISDIFQIITLKNINWIYTLQIIGFHLILIAYILYFWLNKGYAYENIRKTEKGVDYDDRKTNFQKERDDYIENKIKINKN